MNGTSYETRRGPWPDVTRRVVALGLTECSNASLRHWGQSNRWAWGVVVGCIVLAVVGKALQ